MATANDLHLVDGSQRDLRPVDRAHVGLVQFQTIHQDKDTVPAQAAQLRGLFEISARAIKSQTRHTRERLREGQPSGIG